MAKLPEAAPWTPPPYDKKTAAAFQALAKGEAQAYQQVLALQWIVEEAAKTYDQSYYPGSDRDTAFAEGKRFVGNQIIKMTKLNVAAIKDQEDGRSHSRTDRDPDRDPSREYGSKPNSGATRSIARDGTVS